MSRFGSSSRERSKKEPQNGSVSSKFTPELTGRQINLSRNQQTRHSLIKAEPKENSNTVNETPASNVEVPLTLEFKHSWSRHLVPSSAQRQPPQSASNVVKQSYDLSNKRLTNTYSLGSSGIDLNAYIKTTRKSEPELDLDGPQSPQARPPLSIPIERSPTVKRSIRSPFSSPNRKVLLSPKFPILDSPVRKVAKRLSVSSVGGIGLSGGSVDVTRSSIGQASIRTYRGITLRRCFDTWKVESKLSKGLLLARENSVIIHLKNRMLKNMLQDWNLYVFSKECYQFMIKRKGLKCLHRWIRKRHLRISKYCAAKRGFQNRLKKQFIQSLFKLVYYKRKRKKKDKKKIEADQCFRKNLLFKTFVNWKFNIRAIKRLKEMEQEQLNRKKKINQFMSHTNVQPNPSTTKIPKNNRINSTLPINQSKKPQNPPFPPKTHIIGTVDGIPLEQLKISEITEEFGKSNGLNSYSILPPPYSEIHEKLSYSATPPPVYSDLISEIPSSRASIDNQQYREWKQNETDRENQSIQSNVITHQKSINMPLSARSNTTSHSSETKTEKPIRSSSSSRVRQTPVEPSGFDTAEPKEARAISRGSFRKGLPADEGLEDRVNARRERVRQLQEAARNRVQQQQKQHQRVQRNQDLEEEELAKKFREEGRRKQQEINAQNEKKNVKMSEEMKKKLGIARDFRKKWLLVCYGLSPWRRFLQLAIVDWDRARRFHNDQCLRRAWLGLAAVAATVRLDRARKEQRQSIQAAAHYKRGLMKRIWWGWRLHRKTLKAKQRSVFAHFSSHCVSRRSFKAWKVSYERSLRSTARKMRDAAKRGNLVVLKHYWKQWSGFLKNSLEEREIRLRSKNTWSNVQQWLNK